MQNEKRIRNIYNNEKNFVYTNGDRMLKRNMKNAILGGVCSGLAKYLGIEPILVRLGFLFMFLWAGIGPLIYLLLWLIIPADKDGELK